MSVKIKCEVTAYEQNGRSVEVSPPPVMTLESHWNQSGFVVVRIGDQSLTVSVDQLCGAAKRCARTYGER